MMEPQSRKSSGGDDNHSNGGGEQTPRRRISFSSSIIGKYNNTTNMMSNNTSKKADIITGACASLNTREQIAMLRPPEERKAMGRLSRKRARAKTRSNNDKLCITRCCSSLSASLNRSTTTGVAENNGRNNIPQDHENSSNNREDEVVDIPQYTLQSRRRRRGTMKKSFIPFQSFRQKLCCLCSRSTMSIMARDEMNEDGSTTNTSYCLFLDINSVISSYFSWSFRTSYVMLFIGFAAFYYGLILFFALVYYGITAAYPTCVNSAGSPIGTGEGARRFGDCFQLSWTTFSTVGYGIIFPATGASDFDVPTGCVTVGVVGSFEAFLGVLYAGFCGAILFSKVLRSQNNAQVFFSDPIVIRFGKPELSDEGSSRGGDVMEETKDEEEAAPHGDEESQRDWDGMAIGEGTSPDSNTMAAQDRSEEGIPCPILDFRLVNRLHDVPAGEIVEAKLDCVAILDPKVAKQDGLLPNSDVHATHSTFGINEKTTIAELAQVLHDTDTKRATRSLTFHSDDSKQPHMFTKIALDAEEHPYFRRVWFGRHRLDENSPLLTPAARQRVKLNDGYWPKDMNNYQSIKSAIHFRHLLVCIKGVSNANAASVYAQKVYDLVDVNVGYRFVPMNFHADDGSLKTDPYLLNAVYQQRGGGAEPFQ